MANQIVKNDLQELMSLGDVLHKSNYFDDVKSQAQAIVKILAGREMGFGEIASLTGIHVIKGQVSVGANLMAAAVKTHPKYDYRVKVMSDQEVSIEFFQDGKSLGISTFTQEDAKKQGTQNMQKFPRNMLFARAINNGVRWFCPDVFNGNAVYTPDPDELGVADDKAVVVEAVAELAPHQAKIDYFNEWLFPAVQKRTDNYFEHPDHLLGALGLATHEFLPDPTAQDAWIALGRAARHHYEVQQYSNGHDSFREFQRLLDYAHIKNDNRTEWLQSFFDGPEQAVAELKNALEGVFDFNDSA